MRRALEEKELNALWNWLHDLRYDPVKIHCGFADGVQLACLLKQFYPNLVDLHNYKPSSSQKQKIMNWEILNSKVLSKFGLFLGKGNIAKLISSKPGEIEQVLYDIMMLTKYHKNTAGKARLHSQQACCAHGKVVEVILHKKLGNTYEEVLERMIPFSMYEEMQSCADSRAKELAKVQQNVLHLENLVELQNDRIEELLQRLENANAVIQSNSDKNTSSAQESQESVEVENSDEMENLDVEPKEDENNKEVVPLKITSKKRGKNRASGRKIIRRVKLQIETLEMKKPKM